jgi:hypothetical protein
VRQQGGGKIAISPASFRADIMSVPKKMGPTASGNCQILDALNYEDQRGDDCLAGDSTRHSYEGSTIVLASPATTEAAQANDTLWIRREIIQCPISFRGPVSHSTAVPTEFSSAAPVAVPCLGPLWWMVSDEGHGWLRPFCHFFRMRVASLLFQLCMIFLNLFAFVKSAGMMTPAQPFSVHGKQHRCSIWRLLVLACAILVSFACVASGEVDDGELMLHILQAFSTDFFSPRRQADAFLPHMLPPIILQLNSSSFSTTTGTCFFFCLHYSPLLRINHSIMCSICETISRHG